MIELDSGYIKVLGEKVKYKRSNKFSKLIGYIPQNMDLVAQLTIKETLKYFGKIFHIKPEEFLQRYETLKNLLELNFDQQKISEISGGEQRRVSFAIAFINNPQVLILDEPTVGLDVILRNKIWNFMLDATKANNLSILITTHYIAEAQLANKCGFMRNGILLVEDSPSNITASLGSTNLDESFLQLCTSGQQRNFCMEEREEVDDVTAALSDANETKERKHEKFSRSTMEALLRKEMLRFKRSMLVFQNIF
jgi:ABC-type multidrug transport system ATPase subunit